MSQSLFLLALYKSPTSSKQTLIDQGYFQFDMWRKYAKYVPNQPLVMKLGQANDRPGYILVLPIPPSYKFSTYITDHIQQP